MTDEFAIVEQGSAWADERSVCRMCSQSSVASRFLAPLSEPLRIRGPGIGTAPAGPPFTRGGKERAAERGCPARAHANPTPRTLTSITANRKFALLPAFEWLDRRTLLAASPLALATPLQFNAFNDVQLSSQFLSAPDNVNLYSTTLQAGDTINASIVAQATGSGLASLLRVFSANGTPLALDNQEGGDPQLTFQAATTGTYFIGVSSAPNDNYNPTVPNSGTGDTTGLYELDVVLTKNAPLMPDMAGSSFRTGASMAASGDTVPVSFTVENRGGADPGNFQVQVLLSTSNLFGSSSQVLATFTRAQLVASASGRAFSSPAGFSITLPAGLTSGQDYLGTRIIPDPSVPEAGLYDKSGVHRGEDWENLTVVTRATAGTTDLSTVDAGLLTEETGTAGGNDQEDLYTLTVTSSMGDGELTADVTGSGGLVPRLTISAATGEALIQSDSDQIVQALVPGMYLLTVTAQAGDGFLPARHVVHHDQPAAGSGGHRRQPWDGQRRPDQQRDPRSGRCRRVRRPLDQQLHGQFDQHLHGQWRWHLPAAGSH